MSISKSNPMNLALSSAVIFYISVLILSSCASSSPTLRPHSDTKIKIEWLLGNWIRSNELDGRITYEYWNKESDHLYTGLGITIASSGDTIFREDLNIIPILNRWALIVTGVNESPTRFLIEEMSANSFKVQNLENEFPKYIEYSKAGALLKAKVYNDEENMINFDFKKLEN